VEEILVAQTRDLIHQIVVSLIPDLKIRLLLLVVVVTLTVGQDIEVTKSIMKEETQILQKEIMMCDHLSLSSLTTNCCVQSDSAFCMTSNTSPLSDPKSSDRSVSCKCRCHDDQFGYLMGESDEELTRFVKWELVKLMDCLVIFRACRVVRSGMVVMRILFVLKKLAIWRFGRWEENVIIVALDRGVRQSTTSSEIWSMLALFIQ
jgi:hypothetical protein